MLEQERWPASFFETMHLLNFSFIRTALVLSALCLPPSAFSAELAPPERAQFLKQLGELRTKYPSLQADFTEEKQSQLLSRPLVTEGSLAFQVPDKFRREVKGNNPSSSISNGRVLWIFYPKFNEAERYTLGEHSFFDDSMQALTAGLSFDRIDEFYHFKAFRDEAGYRIELIPKRPNLKRLIKTLTLWMQPDFTPMKAEVILPKGDRVLTTYKNVKRVALPASTFEFTPPADARVTKPLGK